MPILCFFVSALLALNGINDTGKFLEEMVKTFKMFEKSDSSSSETTKSKDMKSKTENSDTNSVALSENIDSKSETHSSEDDNSTTVKTNTIASKIENISEGYKKVVLNPLRFPSQVQKLLYAAVKPVSEFFGAGYIVSGYDPKKGPFDWFDTFSGKPTSLLHLKSSPSTPQQ